MKEKMHEIALKNNHDVKISIIPGHFATNHSHVNYYVDLTRIKTNHKVAMEAGKEIASEYNMSKMIDTVVCLEGTEILGSFIAYALAQNGSGINAGKEINVITPELNMNNQLIFRDNIQKMIENRHILLLMSSVSTGKTIRRSVECIQYYNGIVEGVSAIFSAVDHIDGIEINSLFKNEDMPHYETELPSHCQMCAEGRRVEAIINSFGYSKI
jgi:orotate phosphoribosyltransferase